MRERGVLPKFIFFSIENQHSVPFEILVYTSMEEISFGIQMSRTVTVNDLQPFNHFIYDYPLKSKNPITGTNPKKIQHF